MNATEAGDQGIDDEPTPTQKPDHNTIVYVWDNEQNRFVAMPAFKVVCDECDQSFEGMTWQENRRGYPMLVCNDCGQQFYQTNEE